VAELGDITRFHSPKQLMAYAGVVPREHSSGTRERGGDNQNRQGACAVRHRGVGLALPAQPPGRPWPQEAVVPKPANIGLALNSV